MTINESIFELVRQIPEGRVTTYGIIAEALQISGGARQVGWAMNVAHNVNPYVPAHRVVNRNGFLSGRMHFATPTMMQELLEKEGITIVNDTIIGFEKLVYRFEFFDN